MASFNHLCGEESEMSLVSEVADASQAGMDQAHHQDSEYDSDDDMMFFTEEQCELYHRLLKVEANFSRASSQVQCLDRRLESHHARYRRANKDKKMPFRYLIRLQAATVEGVRYAFYMYAVNLAEEIIDLRRKLYGEDTYIEDYIELPPGYSDSS